MGPLLLFALVLIAAALLLKADLFFYLFYALVGVLALSRLWARRSIASVQLERHHDRRAFHGQTIAVEVEVRNRSWLPVLWLRLTDGTPPELASGDLFHRVVALGPREHVRLGYQVTGRRRGYYRFGALVGRGGDLLSSVTYETRQQEGDFQIVYPRIIPLRDLRFPSRLPLGTLPGRDRLFEDPSRVRGLRDYQPGDSLRGIDWKTSARQGSLLVRRLDPSISRDTMLFLNLGAADYLPDERYPASELSITVAASVGAHLSERRQAIGLASNGEDPLLGAMPPGEAGQDRQVTAEPRRTVKVRPAGPGTAGESMGEARPPATLPVGAVFLPLRKGHAHLMQLLDLLARVQMAADTPGRSFLDLLAQKSLGLPWGSTVLVVTPREVEGLIGLLLALRKRGLSVILVLTCPDRGFETTVRRAEGIGVRTVRIWTEKDLDVWR